MKRCIILGVTKRSETNFLSSLLLQHPLCARPGSIKEDRLVEYSDHIANYVNSLYGRWNPRWDVRGAVGNEATLLSMIGGALQELLSRGYKVQANGGDQPVNQDGLTLVTKTPSVTGIEHLPYLFSDS